MAGWIVCFCCISLLVLLLAFLLLSPVSVTVSFLRTNGDDQGSISIRYLRGLFHYEKQISQLDVGAHQGKVHVRAKHSAGRKGKGEQSSEAKVSIKDVIHMAGQLPVWLERFQFVWPALRSFARRIHISRFHWHMRVGTGELITSGMEAGAAWTVVSMCSGWLCALCQLDQQPDLRVESDFQHRALDTSFECILKFRAGYAIPAVLRLRKARARGRDNGTSNSGPDANGDVQHPGDGGREHHHR